LKREKKATNIAPPGIPTAVDVLFNRLKNFAVFVGARDAFFKNELVLLNLFI